MNCQDVRPRLHDHRRGRLAPAVEEEVRSHLAGCAGCARAEEAEGVLDELLVERLPRPAAPPALRRRLAMLAADPEAGPPRRPEPRRWARVLAPALAAGLAVALGAALIRPRGPDAFARLADEAVNDYLRVVASQHPLDVASGGPHQVKPWFEGKLDFAPVVPAPEGGELALQGGAVGYLFDRKAAVLVYALRRHTVTLLAFRAEGLPLSGEVQLGPVTGRTASTRGFHAVFWRAGDVGYALVSDANARELVDVAARFAVETTPGPTR